MKFQIASDLHLEYDPDWELPAGDADVLVLAGDVGIQTHGLAAFRDRARQQPVLYVPGNHEYYCGNFNRTAAALRARAHEWGLYLLDGDAVVLGGVRFLGVTLWTDFALFGPTYPVRRGSSAPVWRWRKSGICWAMPASP